MSNASYKGWKGWKGCQDSPQIASSEITPESIWLNRRNLMKAAAAGAGPAAVGESVAAASPQEARDFTAAPEGTAVKTTDTLTPLGADTP